MKADLNGLNIYDTIYRCSRVNKNQGRLCVRWRVDTAHDAHGIMGDPYFRSKHYPLLRHLAMYIIEISTKFAPPKQNQTGRSATFFNKRVGVWVGYPDNVIKLNRVGGYPLVE